MNVCSNPNFLTRIVPSDTFGDGNRGAAKIEAGSIG
jgi:hypothetical protein